MLSLSGFSLNDTEPSLEILTLGSDAHSPEFVAAHMDEAREILRGIGFTRFCTFAGMKPVFHAL